MGRPSFGVVVALGTEARALAGRNVVPDEVFRLGDSALGVLAGIGHQRAGAGAARLLDHGVRGLLSWGTAGGLSVSAPTGSLLLPERVAAVGGDAAEVDPGWRVAQIAAMSASECLVPGHLVQTETVIARPREKQALARRSGAVAVDMESFSIASVAATAGVPFSVVRVVADDCEGVVPPVIFGANDAWGRPRWSRLLPRLMASPRSIPQLVRLGRAFGMACAVLARVSVHLEPAWRARDRGAAR